MGVKHKFTSGVSDGADNTLVQPSDWNADHQLVASSTDNGIPRFDGTTGDALQDSGVTIDDSDVLTVPDKITVDGVEIWRGNNAISSNLAIGDNALTNGSLSGFDNLFIGIGNGSAVTTGASNTCVGRSAGEAITTGSNNAFFGRLVGRDTTTGSNNVAMGALALDKNTSGSNNFALGFISLRENTTGESNVAIGLGAANENKSGDFNAAVGRNAFFGKTGGTNTGSYNTAIGGFACSNVDSGWYNVCIGYSAGEYVEDGTDLNDNDRCIYIGANARSGANGSTNEIVIGNSAANAAPATTWAEGKGSNTTVIGTDGTTTEFWAHGVHRLDENDIQTDTTTGTKIGTGATQKLALWGATPIAQPDTTHAESAFTENAGGTAVNDDSTFDGYTIRQVVKALRDAGILA